MQARPLYEALDNQGRPYMRPPRVVGELAGPAIAPALAEATQALAAELGMPVLDNIMFGLPVGLVFMSRADIAKHPRRQLLQKLGDDLPLDHCPSYN